MRPPVLASLLFRLGRHGGRRAELAADLEDLFERRTATHGAAYARRRYWKDVLSFFIPGRFAGRLHTQPPDPVRQRSSTVATLGFDLLNRETGEVLVAAVS